MANSAKHLGKVNSVNLIRIRKAVVFVGASHNVDSWHEEKKEQKVSICINSITCGEDIVGRIVRSVNFTDKNFIRNLEIAIVSSCRQRSNKQSCLFVTVLGNEEVGMNEPLTKAMKSKVI